MRRPTTRSTFAALAAATLLATTGCGVDLRDDASGVRTGGGDPDVTVPAGPDGPVVPEGGSFEGTGGAVFLSQAAEATAEVTSQKMTFDMTMEGMPMLGDLTITSEGAFDNESGQGHMTMDMGEMFASMGEDAGLPEGAGTIEMVIDGDTVYMKSPLFSMLGDDSKPWQRIDSAELNEGGALGGGAQSDPSQFLEFLEGASDDVTEVGTEEVRGVETTHVTATLDLEQLLEEAPGDQQANLEEQLEGLGAAADSFRTIPAEAWIDEDGYVRRFTMTFDFSSAAAETPELDGVTMTMDIELYDFNEPVEVEIPDPSQVGELDPSILSGGG